MSVTIDTAAPTIASARAFNYQTGQKSDLRLVGKCRVSHSWQAM